MRKIDIVITMGGLGSRFSKAGYTVPKYMIKARGKTLFEWSMLSLMGYANEVNQYFFIVMRNAEWDVENFINEQCRKLRLVKHRIIVIDYLTDGQSTTAMLAQNFWENDNALLIYNIDTYVEPGEMNSEELKGDGFIPCFQGEGDHWSFVRIDDTGKALEIREKKRISKFCSVGAYYFKSCSLYRDLYNEYYGKPQELISGEKYVAPLYDYLLSKGGEVYISDIPTEKVHVLGTPEELNRFIML